VAVNRSPTHALAAFLTVALVCCSSWGTPVPGNRALLDTRPHLVRLTLADGRQLEVVDPRARGDTLVGDTVVFLSRTRSSSYPVAIPFTEVRSMSAREFSLGRTIALAGGISVGMAIIAAGTAKDHIQPQPAEDPGGMGCEGPGPY
jgi:hypothetical protein